MTRLSSLFDPRFPSWATDGHVLQWIRVQFAMFLFWSAIFLPALYLPLLLTRLTNAQELLLFLGLFGLHIIALIGGRSYPIPYEQ